MDSKKPSKLFFASDHAGFILKSYLLKHCKEELKLDCVDCGPSSDARCDYPDFAAKLS
jgi:ribose 5-phosphate isomerase B